MNLDVDFLTVDQFSNSEEPELHIENGDFYIDELPLEDDRVQSLCVRKQQGHDDQINLMLEISLRYLGHGYPLEYLAPAGIGTNQLLHDVMQRTRKHRLLHRLREIKSQGYTWVDQANRVRLTKEGLLQDNALTVDPFEAAKRDQIWVGEGKRGSFDYRWERVSMADESLKVGTEIPSTRFQHNKLLSFDVYWDLDVFKILLLLLTKSKYAEVREAWFLSGQSG